MSSSSTPVITSKWERSAVSDAGDRTSLLVTIRSSSLPAQVSSPPLDVGFALDRSGSMSGAPIQLVKQAVRECALALRPDDRVALVTYDDRIDVLYPLQAVSPSTIVERRNALDGVDARGSTNLGDGWLTACRELAGHAPNPNGNAGLRIRRSILLTDGLANVGITSVDELVTHAHSLRQKDVSTSAMGVGHHFDESLLSSMAEAGGGDFAFVNRPSEIPAFFARELDRVQRIVLAGTVVTITLPKSVFGRLVSAFPEQRLHKTFDIAIGDIPANDEVSIVFDVTTPASVAGAMLGCSVTATWKDVETAKTVTVDITPEPLEVVPQGSHRLGHTDSAVSIETALQRAARQQREAMRLDREGRFQESRQFHRQARTVLDDAPDSPLIAERRAEARGLAEYSAASAFPEQIRKQSVHNVMRRGRGRDDRS